MSSNNWNRGFSALNQNPRSVITYQSGAYYRPVSYHIPANVARADVNFRPAPSTQALISTTAMYGGCIPLPK